MIAFYLLGLAFLFFYLNVHTSTIFGSGRTIKDFTWWSGWVCMALSAASLIAGELV